MEVITKKEVIMKKTLLLSIVLSFFSVDQINTAPGCQDNSWHLKKKYDAKTYHYVQCNCQCHKWPQAADGTCTKCGHRHDPGTWTILTKLPEKEFKKLAKNKIIRWRVVNKNREKRKNP